MFAQFQNKEQKTSKSIIILLLLQFYMIAGVAQDKTIMILESGLPYTDTYWFYSGHGNALDEAQIKDQWKKNRDILSAAYTRNGWFLTMGKNTGFTDQSYILQSKWPGDWIMDKWKEGYQVTALSHSNHQWLAVVSKGSRFTSQSMHRGKWNALLPWIKDLFKSEYQITDLAYDGTEWYVVMSQNSQYATQGYFWVSASEDISAKIKEKVWDRGYRIHLMEYGEGGFEIIYGNYKTDNGRKQALSIDQDDIKDYLAKEEGETLLPAYIGGGYTNTSSSNGNYTAQTTPKKFTKRYYDSYVYRNAEIYYTFEGDLLYQSDKDGNKLDYLPIFKLIEKKENGDMEYAELRNLYPELEYLREYVSVKGDYNTLSGRNHYRAYVYGSTLIDPSIIANTPLPPAVYTPAPSQPYSQPERNINSNVNKEMCLTCNGTGVVPNGSGFDDGFGSTKCFGESYSSGHVCDIIMCPTCHQSHCKTLSSHKRCKMCNGMRYY